MGIEALIGLSLLFIMKATDNILGANKTILIQNNRRVLAALNVMVHNLVFYTVIKTVNNAEGYISLTVVCLAGGLGTYSAIRIGDFYLKPRIYVNTVLSDSDNDILELSKFMDDKKITNIVEERVVESKDVKKLYVTIYSEDKEESKIIDNYINNNKNKFERIVTKG